MSDPIRVLHFADTHIGMENYGRTDPETGLSSRVRDFLRRLDEMIDYARENDVDLAIFAGDAFKTRNPTPTYEREFAFRVQELAELCPVVLLVGNHDLPASVLRASSIEIYHTLQVPKTHLGREYVWHEITTKRGPVMVATAPYPVRQHLLGERVLPHAMTIGEVDALLRDELIARLEQLAAEAADFPDDVPRILVGHFSVVGALWGSERSVMLGRDVSVPLSVLDNPAWDYVALGHIHRHQCLTPEREGTPPVVYSGSVERVDFGEESEKKGFVWVELARGAARWEFVPLPARRFVTLRVDVRGAGDPTQVVLEAIAREDVRDAVVRVIIKADPEAETLLQDRLIRGALRDAGVYYIAALQREVERPHRLRLGTSPEGLTPEELLERYLAAKEIAPERITELLEHARSIFQADL